MRPAPDPTTRQLALAAAIAAAVGGGIGIAGMLLLRPLLLLVLP